MNGELDDSRSTSFLKHYCRTFQIEEARCPSLSRIRSWYKSKSGKALNSKITTEESAPIFGSKVFTQKVSSAIGIIRDRFTLGLIEAILSKHRNVTVVYGASHYSTLKPAIEAGLGQAKEIVFARD
jgi:hypothetical protein